MGQLFVIGVLVTDSCGGVSREVLDEDWRLPRLQAEQFAGECNAKYENLGRHYQMVEATEIAKWMTTT